MSRSTKSPRDAVQGPWFMRLDTSSVRLPTGTLTSHEPIEVDVPASPPITEEELLERFAQLAREQGEVRELLPGESVALGDDVQLDVVAYANERLIPFSLRTRWWLEMKPLPELPGFVETLAGSAVGDRLNISLNLPANYPVESLRGVRAHFLIDLRAAREVTPANTHTPDFLRRAARGRTLQDVMNSLGEDLLQERAAQQVQEGRDQVLEVLASRLDVKLPRSLIDEEIRRRWVETEAQAVIDKGFSPVERIEAFEAWKTDPDLRAQTEQRLRIALALRAVAEQDGIQVEPDEVFDILAPRMKAHGLKPSEVREALATPQTARPLYNLAWHLRLVDHVMSTAIVHYGD